MHGMVVCAKEVTDIHQPAVVGMIDLFDKRFNALSVLQNITVVFGAGAYALGGGIFGYFADGGGHINNSFAPVDFTVPGGIVTKRGGTQCCGDVNLGLHTVNFFRAAKEICMNGISDDIKADLGTVIADQLCKRDFAFGRLNIKVQINELDTVETGFLCNVANVKIVCTSGFHILGEAVA